jgi:hypothetical protein
MNKLILHRVPYEIPIYFLNGLIYSQCMFWTIGGIIERYKRDVVVKKQYPNFEKHLRLCYNQHITITSDIIDDILNNELDGYSDFDCVVFRKMLARLGLVHDRLVNFLREQELILELISMGYQDVRFRESEFFYVRKSYMEKFKDYEYFTNDENSEIRYYCALQGKFPTILKKETNIMKHLMIENKMYSDVLRDDKSKYIRGSYYFYNPNEIPKDNDLPYVHLMRFYGKLNDHYEASVIDEMVNSKIPIIIENGIFLRNCTDMEFIKMFLNRVEFYSYVKGTFRDNESEILGVFNNIFRFNDRHFLRIYEKFVSKPLEDLYRNIKLGEHVGETILYSRGKKQTEMIVSYVENGRDESVKQRSWLLGDIRLEYVDSEKREHGGFWTFNSSKIILK